MSCHVDGEVALNFGSVQLVRKFWSEPIDVYGTSNRHHLELAMLPYAGTGRASFPDLWGPNRFEPFGEVFLLPAEHVIHAKSDCRQQNSIACTFEPGAVSAWLGRDLQWTDSRLRSTLDISNPSVRSLLFRIGEEIRNPGFASDTMVELMAAQVAIELSRHLSRIEERQRKTGLSPWCLKRIDERLGDGGAPPSLAELASLCSMSVRHLTRAFRLSRGRSVGSYIAEHRIEHAKRLLGLGLRVKSVAHSAGFTAASNFAAAFYRATGETPRQYRQRVNRCAADAGTVRLNAAGVSAMRRKVH